MRQISCTLCQQISRTVFLTLAVSLTTGCSWVAWSNSSIRGGDNISSSQGALGDHDALKVSLVEKDRTARKKDKAEKDEIELSFAFEKPVEADIGEGCSGNRDCSHEKITYESEICKKLDTCKADLFVLEFDDQGRLYYPQQMEHLFEFLKNTMSPGSDCTASKEEPCFDDISLVVAAHGWRHNADFEDWNLRQLREVLYDAVLFEAYKSSKDEHWNPSNKPRRVVGVYLGWRGATVKEGWIETNLLSKVLFTVPVKLSAVSTFWDRKGAALDVALGSIRELFARLGHVRIEVNDMGEKARMMGRDRKWYDSCDKRAQKRNGKCVAMRTLILGHSFGSLAIYNAISESLIDSVSGGVDNTVSAGDCSSPSANKPVSSPYADLIVLINPAFEGARFEPLYQASLNRMKRSCYSSTQDPVLVLVTGTSDWATGYAFYIGRLFSTLFQDNSPESKVGNDIPRRAEEERNANRNAVGHIPRYMTHYLDSFPTVPDIEPKKYTDSSLDLCLKTGWEKLASTGFSGEKPLAEALDENAVVWKQKLQASIETKTNWPARAFCGGLRLSVAMQEAQEGEDPLDDLSDDQATDHDPWSNQLVTKEILRDKWGQGPRSPHNPIWVVRTKDEAIVNGHNGFHNPRMEGFIQQLYREALNPQ
jgi:hypothetical protein